MTEYNHGRVIKNVVKTTYPKNERVVRTVYWSLVTVRDDYFVKLSTDVTLVC